VSIFSKLWRVIVSVGCVFLLAFCQVAPAMAFLAVPGPAPVRGQKAVPHEMPEDHPAGESRTEPLLPRTFEEINGYHTVAVTPYLSVKVRPEISDTEWMNSHDREELRSYLVEQVRSLTVQTIDPKKTRLISFVQDKATSTVIANSATKQFLIDEPIDSLGDLEEVLRNNQQNFLIFVGHLAADQQEFGGFAIDKLLEATKRRGAPALFLGCNTALAFGSGTTHDVNSVEVMERLGEASHANTLGSFLAALTGPDLHLRIDFSLLDSIAQRLQISIVDQHDVVQGRISVQGFSQLATTPPLPKNRLSLLSRFLRISYAMLMSILCSWC
jgi:hypothetical protein